MPCAPSTRPISKRRSEPISAAGLSLRRGLGRRRRGTRRRLGAALPRLGPLLCLDPWRGFLRRLADLGLRPQAGIAEEARHPIARRRAHLEPMLDTLALEHHALLMAAIEHGIVSADLLDEAAVAGIAGIRDHDRIERALLGAAASHANLEGHVSPSRFSAGAEPPHQPSTPA